MTAIGRQALLEVKNGKNVDEVIEELLFGSLEEQSYSPPAHYGHAAGRIGNAITAGVGVHKAYRAARRTPASAFFARAVQGILGGAAQIGSKFLSHAITGAYLDVLGGPESTLVSGQGTETRYHVTMNVPPSVLRKQGAGPGGAGASSEVPNPAVNQAYVSQVRGVETEDGNFIEMYRVDPVTGRVMSGAPAKTITVHMKGRQPANIKQLERGIGQQLGKLANALIGGKPIRVPPMVVYRNRGRGRPSKRTGGR